VIGRVVVVGGGLAGITTALDLADAGADVVLLERRRHLGGLTWSFRRGDLWFDNGQHVFLRCCTAYRAFIERIGAAPAVTLQPRLDVPVLAPGGRIATLRRAPLPAPFHLGPSLARYHHLGLVDRARAVRGALALRRLDSDDPALDNQSFGDWLAAHGQTPATVGHLWDLIARPTLNLPAQEASLGAAVKVFRTGLLDAADAADIGWAVVPLVEAHGEPARRALTAGGVDVRTDVTVDGVTVGDGVTVTAGADTVSADALVLALPPDGAARLLPGGALDAGVDPRRLQTAAVVDIQLVLDRRVTDLPMVAAVDSLVQFVFDRTAASGCRRGQVLAVSISAADGLLERRPDDLVRDVHAALGSLFAGADRSSIVDAVVTKERAATFRPVPGAGAHRAGAATRIPGVFLAGSWTATGWPATMESAVRSGHAATHALLEQTSVSSPEEMFA
jgi:squalene-associated FAD-dependent desaturase